MPLANQDYKLITHDYTSSKFSHSGRKKNRNQWCSDYVHLLYTVYVKSTAPQMWVNSVFSSFWLVLQPIVSKLRSVTKSCWLCWPRRRMDLEVTSGMQCGTAGSKINATGWCCFIKSMVRTRVVSPHLMSHSFSEARSSFWDATGSQHFCCLCSNLSSLQFNLKNPEHFLSGPQGAKRFL